MDDKVCTERMEIVVHRDQKNYLVERTISYEKAGFVRKGDITTDSEYPDHIYQKLVKEFKY